MTFSESRFNQIENFQQIHLEYHCILTFKAELIGFTRHSDNLFLELRFLNGYSGMCALTQSKIIEIEKFKLIPNNNMLRHLSRL